jgi:hypothetical protein
MTNANCIWVLSADDHPVPGSRDIAAKLFIAEKTVKTHVKMGSDELTLLLVLEQLYEGVIPWQQTTAEKDSSSRLGFPDQERQ